MAILNVANKPFGRKAFPATVSIIAGFNSGLRFEFQRDVAGETAATRTVWVWYEAGGFNGQFS
jgi:hypothetical protein